MESASLSPQTMLTAPDDEAKRLRRQRDLAALGVLMNTEPTVGVGKMLSAQADSDSKDSLRTRLAEYEAAQRAQERAADQQWRQQVQDDLNAYRQQSIAAYGRGAQSQDDGLTAYQRKMLERQEADDQRRANEARQGRVTDLAKVMESSGMAELDSSVNAANELLASYNGKDIPGIGGAGNVPLIGKYAGGEEGRHVRSTIAAVRNAVLKARSGGAVTPQEGDRLLEELGMMLGYDDDDLRNAWGAFVERHNARLSNILAPYREVVPDYQRANPRFHGEVTWSPPNARGAQGSLTPSTGPGTTSTAPQADYVIVNGRVVPNRR